jgi:transposase
MAKPNDLSKSLVAFDYDNTLMCVIEMSGTSWLVQKLPVNSTRLLEQVERLHKEMARAGWTITRTVVAYERRVLADPAAPRTRV